MINNKPSSHMLAPDRKELGFLPIDFVAPLLSNFPSPTVHASIIETSSTGNGNYVLNFDPEDDYYQSQGTLTGLVSPELWSNIGGYYTRVNPTTIAPGWIAIATGPTNKYAKYYTSWVYSTFGFTDNWRTTCTQTINRTITSVDIITIVSGDTYTIYSIENAAWVSSGTPGFISINSTTSQAIVPVLFVATKATGQIYYSSSGTSWSLSGATAGTMGLRSIANDSTTFIIISLDSGTGNIKMMKSTNGSTWSSSVLSIPYNGSKIEYSQGADVFMILNADGTYYISDDVGVTWEMGIFPQFFTYTDVYANTGPSNSKFTCSTANSRASAYTYSPYPVT